jgi:gas vesicle protein
MVGNELLPLITMLINKNDTVTIWSYIASAVSVILGIFAIILSYKFFVLSSKESNHINENSIKMKESYEYLKELVERIYNDSFNLNKQTFEHFYPEDKKAVEKVNTEVQKRIEEGITQIQKEKDIQIEDILQNLKITQEQFQTLKNDLGKIVNNTIIETRNFEEKVSETRLRYTIEKDLYGISNHLRSNTIPSQLLLKKYNEDIYTSVLEELNSLRNEGKIEFSGNFNQQNSVIHLFQPYRIILEHKFGIVTNQF